MHEIFVGSEALAAGTVTPYELRTFYRRLLPDVYGPRRWTPTQKDRIHATWLWSRRQGVVSGLSAAAVHGAKWVGVHEPVELNWPNHRAPNGVVVRADTIEPDEVVQRGDMTVTTAERTAFDLARRGGVGNAVARLDALARATQFKIPDVRDIASRHPRVRGLRQVDRMLDLVDAGSESPKETWLRLLLIDARYPRPQTQIPVLGSDGYPRYFLDMGWEEERVAVEYDGDDHREKRRWRGDIVRAEYLAHLRWKHVRVVAGDRERDVLRRVARAWPSRLR